VSASRIEHLHRKSNESSWEKMILQRAPKNAPCKRQNQLEKMEGERLPRKAVFKVEINERFED
jgi:hypothetical protein